MISEQQAAFIEGIKTENISLEAGAGCGKTNTLLEADKAGALPQNTLAVVFNKKNQQEMQEKFSSRVVSKTMNSLGHSAWMRQVRRGLKLDEGKPNALIKDCGLFEKHFETDLWRLQGLARNMGYVPRGAIGSPKSLCSTDEDQLNEWISDNDFDFGDMQTDEIKRDLDALLVANIRAGFSGVIDFNDQIYLPAIYRSSMEKYPLVLVDEAQDLSHTQHILLELVNHERCSAVGDPNQAIYGFRGADSSSMSSLRARFKQRTLPLNYSFRCPQRVVAEAQRYVPSLKPTPQAPLGLVRRHQTWHKGLCAENTFIVCRNVAPLMKVSFALIRQGVGVKVLGREIGLSLKRLVAKQKATNVADLIGKLTEWKDSEIAKAQAKGLASRMEQIFDRYECVMAIAEELSAHQPAQTVEQAIERLFSPANTPVVAGTIHKMKGLEEERVLFLDAWRIPSKKAQLQAERGNYAPMQQESNCAYVATTRAKQELHYVTLDGFQKSASVRPRDMTLDDLDIKI